MTADLTALELGLEQPAISALPLYDDPPTVAAAPKRPLWRRFTHSVLPVLVALGVLVLGWQIVFWAKVEPEVLLPSPGQVLSELQSDASSGILWNAIYDSVGRGLIGFVMAAIIATPLGLLIGRVDLLRRALRPLLSGLQTMPSVAWVAAATVLFGLTRTTLFAVVLLGSVPAIANGLISALDGVPPLLERAGKVLGMRRLAIVRHVLLPSALPGYLGGLRQGWAFAWHALMTAEAISFSPKLGHGLGELLTNGSQNVNQALVVGAGIVILFAGLLVDRLVFTPVERHVLRRRGLAVA